MRIKRNFIVIVLLLLVIIPINIKAITVDEARKAIADYAYYVYNEKKDEICYVSPSEVNQEKNFLNYKTKTKNGKACYGMDCNAFVGFIIYNALQIQATSEGKIQPFPGQKEGPLTSSGRPALNNSHGWCSHSCFYDSRSYALNVGETIASASKRINLESLLEPGDLIGVVGYGASSYPSADSSDKFTHIMVYVGDGKYIHNRGSGVSLDPLSNISFGLKVGSSFAGDKHGAITVLKLTGCLENINSSVINNFRYPDGNGNFLYSNSSGGSSGGGSSSNGGGSGTNIQLCGEYTPDSKASICKSNTIAKVISLVVLIIKIIRIAVPIILIFSLAFLLIKSIMNENANKDLTTIAVKRISAAALIFILPIFINMLLSMTGNKDLLDECLELAKNPIITTSSVGCKTDGTDDGPIEVDNDVKVTKDGIYIVISGKNISEYYFSTKKETLTGTESKWIKTTLDKIDFILLPGEHYIYIKTSDGKISENQITIQPSDIVITNDVSDIKLLTTNLDDFLKSKGSSIDEFNSALARSVYIAGVKTRDGVSAAALALTQILYKKYKIKVPYAFSNYVQLGARANWGSSGLHCGGFVAWTFSQANFKMNSGIGSSAQICGWGYGSISPIKSSYHGQVGDVLTTSDRCSVSRHVAILNFYDNEGFYLTESNARTGKDNNGKMIINENIGIVTTYDKFSSHRWQSIMNMEITYKNKGNNTDIPSGF